MTKEDMIQVLRGVGVNENTVTAMSNAFDIGVEYERNRCLEIVGRLHRLGAEAQDVGEEIIASAKP